MKIISDARSIWKHYSTQALVLVGSLQGTWAALPDGVRDSLPKNVGVAIAWITLVVAVLGIGGKLVDQTPKEPK